MPPSFGLRNLDLFETEYHINTRMHSSRMRTARSLLYRGSLSGEVSIQGISVRGDLCPGESLSGRPPGRNMGLEAETPRKKHGTRDRGPQKKHVTRDRDPPRRNMGPGNQTGSDIIQRPHPLLTEWQMRVKTLPCPKLRLRAVTIS